MVLGGDPLIGQMTGSTSNSKLYLYHQFQSIFSGSETKDKTLILGNLAEPSVNSGLAFDAINTGVFFTTDTFAEFNQLKHKNLVTGEVTIISQDINWDVDGFVISSDGKRAAFKVNENGFSALYLLNTQTLQYQQVEDLPMGLVGGMQFNEAGSNLGLSLNTYQSPPPIPIL